jgi:hypothetical protein
MKIAWWSGGITSAVACKLCLDKDPQTLLYFIETGSHHPDTLRFKADCEAWYGKSIITLQQDKYVDHFDVVESTRYINGPRGARCTRDLKRWVREVFERKNSIEKYAWGFEYGAREQARAERIKQTIPKIKHYFPLIVGKIDKQEAINIVVKAGIQPPEMYRLGYTNNNCVGCVKGGGAYWNKIRTDFPDIFDRMAKLEREIGHSCLQSYYLDELPEDFGRGKPPFLMDCGAVGEGCEIRMSTEFYHRE